jgi:DNA-binding NarL/FixJ family response regulator
MTVAISGPAGAGGTAAAPAVLAQSAAAAAPPSTASAAAAEDKVTISAAAQEMPQPMSVQVLALHNQGQSVPQIATQLAISPSAVQSYLGTPAAAQK